MTVDPGPAPDGQLNRPESGGLHIFLTVGSTVHRATLRDTPAGRDFAALLPLNLTLKDFAGTEKISDLPSRLSTAEAPTGAAADVGDIAFYAPWGNLAIFYRPFHYAEGLGVLGQRNGTEHSRHPQWRHPGHDRTRVVAGSCTGNPALGVAGGWRPKRQRS